jgi:hypothetical protein
MTQLAPTVSPAPAPVNDVQRVSHCPKCAYELTGLPDEGLCPECGRAYDQTCVFLYGTALGEHAGVHNATPWRIVAIALFTLLQFNQLLFHMRDWRYLALFGYVAVIFLLQLLIRFGHDQLAPTQVRLGPHGCAQVDTFHSTFAFDMLRIWIALGIVIALAWAATQILARHWITVIGLLCVAPFIVLLLVLKRRLWWNPVPAPPPDAALIDAVKDVPWSDIANVALTVIKPQRYRLRISPIAPFWKLRFETVDVEVRLSEEQAKALLTRIHCWREMVRPGQPAIA